MSGIILSSAPENIYTSNTVQLQTWNFTPGNVQVDYIQGGLSPAPVTVACKLLDVLGTTWVNGLSDISYRTYLAPASGTYNNVVMSGALYTGSSVYQPYLDNGIQGDVIFSFQNMSLLPIGTKTVQAVFEIAGKTSSGQWQVISSYTYFIAMRVYSASAPQITPATLSFNWVVGAQTNALLPLTISGAYWSIFLPGPLLAGGTNFNQTGVPGGTLVTGNGTVSMSIVLTQAAIAPAATSNPIQYSLSVNGGLMTIPLTITVIQATGLYISRGTMEFVAYRGISEAAALSFTIYHNSTYVFQLPPWVTIQPGSGSGSTTATVTALPAMNFQEGVYTGTLKILNASSQVELGTIAITYRVIELLDNPYWNKSFAFTLDPVFLEFVNALDNIYYKLSLSAAISQFYNAQSVNYNFPFKVPLFQHRQKFNIGMIIERLLGSMPDLIQEHQVPYHPALVTLEIQALSTVDSGYSNTITLPGLKFVSGMDPGMIDGFAILDINPGPQRVYPESYRFLNLLSRIITSAALFKNEEQVDNFNIPSGISTTKISFADYDAKKGDVFEFRYYRPGGYIAKQYLVFPAARQSIIVVWENEYRLKSVLELTGDYTIKSDFENKSQNYSIDLVSKLVKLETDKVSKVTINTGFLLQSDQATIESLARARRAILLSANNVLQVVPISKGVENVNSNRDVVSFDLEFQINPNINEEVYSF